MKTILSSAKAGLAGTLFGLALTSGTTFTGHAMSSSVSLLIEPEWPSTNDPGNVALYKITVTRLGQGDLVVDLTSAGLPDGATATFSLNPVRFVGQVPTVRTSILSINLTNPVPTDPIPFTVTANDGRTTLTVTNEAGKNFDAAFASNPNSRPVLALDLIGKSNLKVRGKGASAKKYRVEANASLGGVPWAAIGLTHADVNGRFSFMDSGALNSTNLFYRTSGPVNP